MSVFYLVRAEVQPQTEEAWTNWMISTDIPEVLKEPGFIKATLGKIDTGPVEWSQFGVLYELDSREKLDTYLTGSTVRRLRAEHESRFGATVRLYRIVMNPVRSFDAPNGSKAPA